MGSKPSIDYGVWCTVEGSRSGVAEGGNRSRVQIPINQQTLQVGLEKVPAGSHKPNDGGSSPSPATNGPLAQMVRAARS